MSDPLAPFATARAPRGMVTTVDALATGAGVAMLRAGGTAADAAVAANAVLAVTTQHMCGLGGDLFALVHRAGTPPAALNASGRAGSGADPDRLRAEGHTRMPFRGDIRSVPVPGCVDGWCALHARFGRLPLADVLTPAIEYARDGFPASPLLAGALAGIDESLRAAGGYAEVGAPGDPVRRPGVARALEAVAAAGRGGWYEGRFGRGLLAVGRGEYTPDDLSRSYADWVDPIRVRAFGHDVWTVPPNSQGYLTLRTLWLAGALGLPTDPDDPAWPHLLVEAAKHAGYRRRDELHEHAPGAELVDVDVLESLLRAIDPARASTLAPPAEAGGTIHLNAADADGLVVSLTQSNCSGFGAGIVVEGVGVFLQNRGMGFSLEPGHPAEYGPRRRPPHTLCPTLVTTPDGAARFAIGTMGADSQPMIIAQVLARLLHANETVAGAVAAPRWVLANPTHATFAVWDDPAHLRVRVEEHAPPPWAAGLRARGHDVEAMEPFSYVAGHANVIEVESTGYAGAADPRARTGSAAGW